MKQYSVRLSQNAYNDLESIYSYISYQLLSPGTAANIYNELLDSIESLKVMPKRVPLMKSTKEATSPQPPIPIIMHSAMQKNTRLQQLQAGIFNR